jgi:hypothetical protein
VIAGRVITVCWSGGGVAVAAGGIEASARAVQPALAHVGEVLAAFPEGE